MELVWTVVLAPTDAASRLEVLVAEVAALLEVIDAFDAVTPPELVSENLGLLYLDPLLSDDVLPHLQHRHRVLVRIRRIEVIRRRFIEVRHSLLPPHFFLTLALSFSLSFTCDLVAAVATAGWVILQVSLGR